MRCECARAYAWGWFHAPDKSVHALFGYFNRNAEQPGAELALANAQGRGGNDDPLGSRELFTECAQGKDGEIYPPNVGKLVMPGRRWSSTSTISR